MCVVVTPRVGVWIETNLLLLKVNNQLPVTPRVGVWIETPLPLLSFRLRKCHSPRGSVD